MVSICQTLQAASGLRGLGRRVSRKKEIGHFQEDKIQRSNIMKRLKIKDACSGLSHDFIKETRHGVHTTLEMLIKLKESQAMKRRLKYHSN